MQELGERSAPRPDRTRIMSDIIELRRSFEISLRSRNRAPGTIKSYLQALDLFREFSVTAGYPTAVGMVIREQVEAFQADQLVRWSSKTAAIRYWALLQFFKWAVREGEVSDSPMAGMGPPSLPEVSVPVVSDDDLKKLLKVCSGMSFVDRRLHGHLEAVHRLWPSAQRSGHAGRRGRQLGPLDGQCRRQGRPARGAFPMRPRRRRRWTGTPASGTPRSAASSPMLRAGRAWPIPTQRDCPDAPSAHRPWPGSPNCTCNMFRHTAAHVAAV